MWALGMVFFELVSRAVPFADSGESSVIRDWILKTNGEVISEICETNYPFFAQVMRGGWKKNPRERITACEVVETLSRHHTP